ncbi:MAG: ComF family protein [Oscillospiraceae bacterium]
MSRFFDILAHIFLPNRCMFCKRTIEYDKLICDGCHKNAPLTDLSKCLICGQEECHCQNYFRYLVTPFYYEMGADTAIRDLKFNNNMQNAKKLAICMSNCIKKTSLNQVVNIIIPAPLYKDDFKKRGFNQAYELAREISKLIKKPLCEDSLIKIKKTQKQHDLFAAQRYKNVESAFVVENKTALAQKTVLLIDDVFTTGSTMNACAKVLFEAGAKEVICLVAAKTRYIVN